MHVSNFAVEQPQLWAINIMNGTNIHFDNMRVSAVSSAAPEGAEWVQNTDGFGTPKDYLRSKLTLTDTMDAKNITLTNFTYTGADDCVAIKPRSYDIHMTNITCLSGNGLAIGSLGQYLQDASVENVSITNAEVPSTDFGTYIKTWMGERVPQDNYESAGVPRGGGWGVVRNILFKNVDVNGAERPVAITQNNGDNEAGEYAGTSHMQIEGVRFVGYHGMLEGSDDVTVECSEVNPCHDISFEDWDVHGQDGDVIEGECQWTTEGGVTGLEGC